MAGAPKGNTNAVKGNLARRALQKAVERQSGVESGECIESFEVLVEVWEKAIKQAKDDGNIQALNAIMDRLDGRPGQTIDISANVDLGIQDMSDSDLERRLKQLEQANEQSTKD